jgi:HPt (histidine-containing phosphotransfer) domain-containing protein
VTIDDSAVVRLEEIGGPSLVISLIDLVLQELPPRVAGVRAALEEQDRTALGLAAHNVVSGTGHFGAFELAALAQQTERAAAGSGWPALAELVARLEQLAEEFLAYLARERARRVPA